MEKTGYFAAMAGGAFSVYLIGWQGYQGASANWVYGFLTVFWSLLMFLRLMTLTVPSEAIDRPAYLAQKIIASFRDNQEKRRQTVLNNALSASFMSFILCCVLFSLWQIYCAAFPAQGASLESIMSSVQQFPDMTVNLTQIHIFDWGQNCLLFLSLCMMGFVLRSHTAERGMTRATLLIIAGYAAAGYIAFAGLSEGSLSVAGQSDLVGNGAGALTYLLGTMPHDKILTLFDILLLENGVAGLGILTFICFIPLGYISLAAQKRQADKMVVTCGVITALAMILAVFLPFTPVLGGFMALCWMGVFLAWGACENSLQAALDKRTKREHYFA